VFAGLIGATKNATVANPWRALEILKNDKNLGGQPVLASPTANSGGIRPPVIYAHAAAGTYNSQADTATPAGAALARGVQGSGPPASTRRPTRFVRILGTSAKDRASKVSGEEAKILDSQS
jgi:hypothetical protein